MRPPMYYRDYGYHYPYNRYGYQSQVYYQQNQYPPVQQVYYDQPQFLPAQQVHQPVQAQMQAPSHWYQGYYYQPVYHCPTCGTPIYVVYVASPETSPNGVVALLIAILVLLAIDVVFLRKR